jgi:SAM-dependent methyltransferase
LVQTEDYAASDELFRDDYAYFSSTSTSWLEHARSYADEISSDLGLGPESFVVEVASNDGYLLQNFVHKGVGCLGIEPTASTAAAAERKGVPVIREFFGKNLAARLSAKKADLIIGNNVLAHVPDINDFCEGLKVLLKPGGLVTLEFPHLLNLIELCQFDTIYHEHFSYLSLHAVERILRSRGLRVHDARTLPTHGGSLRIYASHEADAKPVSGEVGRLLALEKAKGLLEERTYENFQTRAERIKDQFVSFLIENKRAGNVVAGYGAAAKGNTLLNFAGIKPDLVRYVCDAAEAKQGKFLPGSRIPIVSPATLLSNPPDHLVIFPWNLAGEIISHYGHLRSGGLTFVKIMPEIEYLQ